MELQLANGLQLEQNALFSSVLLIVDALATTSFDGYLYLIEGSSGCADVVDIGETSYAISSLLCEILVAFLGTVLTSIKCAHFFAL